MAISTRPEIQDRCCRVFSLSAALFHVHRWKHSEAFKGASVESILKAIDGGKIYYLIRTSILVWHVRLPRTHVL